MSHDLPLQLHPVSILVADDNEPWRRWVCSVLETQERLRVVAEASDGLDAVEKAGQLTPDLILLDIGLPNLNGILAANRIKQVACGAKLIFLTLEGDQEVVKAVLSDGAFGYVLKADAAELLAAIDAVLRGERYLSRQVVDQVARSAAFELLAAS